MDPDHLRELFDGSAIVIMLIWGLLCKYVPFLAKIPNWSIGWVNLIGYVLARLGAGAISPAHAQVVDSLGADSSLVVTNTGSPAVNAISAGILNAGFARVVYETLVRALFERIFKFKFKSDPPVTL